jgi:hypothetical protein
MNASFPLFYYNHPIGLRTIIVQTAAKGRGGINMKKRRIRRTSAIWRMPKRLALGLAGKSSGLWYSYRLTRSKAPMNWDFRPDKALSTSEKALTNRTYTATRPSERLESEFDRQLVSDIREETTKLNLNNVTRTAAYWDMYRAFPELQWALLAHLVSRNGGWNMTDLKGEWLPSLVNDTQTEHLFLLLETCNAYIFGDAYPQLALYARGRRAGTSYAYLLPCFGVSAFMHPFWERFEQDGNPVPLSAALIVNEQHFIQKRVVEHPFFRSRVIDTLLFRGQSLLQLNQIVFPLAPDIEGRTARLAGRVLENFADLEERISFGKSLYAMLFGYPDILRRVSAFAARVPHTGSRADYWPNRFATEPLGTTKGGTHANLVHPALSGERWHSPELADAWPNRPLEPAEPGDWYQSASDFAYTKRVRRPFVVDLTHEHLLGQHKLQAAALLARNFMNGDSRRRIARG